MTEALRRFLAQGEGDFGALALALFEEQIAHNPDYAAFCAGVRPQRWEEIPAVPVALFRDLPLCSFPIEETGVIFRTSGTTGPRGVVRAKDSELYDLGAEMHALAVLGALPRQGVSLVSTAPDSSLGHMCRRFAPALLPCFDPARGLDVAGALAALSSATEPLFVPATAFALAELLEGMTGPIPLPAGSVLMVTGGYKGRLRSIPEGQMAEALAEAFPGARLVGEYGMTELSSQLWSARLGDPFVPPPWLRVRAVDPWTGEDAPVGVLRFYDLANRWHVLAVETRDRGEVLPDGSVVLHGRLGEMEPRGCSLTVEELWARRLPPPTPLHAPILRARATLPADEGDPARIAAVMRAITRLRRRGGADLGEGLSPAHADHCLGGALDLIRPEGLAAALQARGDRPADLLLVTASGVFTAPLEWMALYAAAGIRLRVKAPAEAPQLCLAFGAALAEEGLPVEVFTHRDLGDPEVVVAFGGDAGVEAVARATPGARHLLFGHRFSVGLVSANPLLAQALAWDTALYDTRGCMAPVAWFVLGDPGPLAEALLSQMSAMEAYFPRGALDPSLGPEWRRREGLARARGAFFSGAGCAVSVLPASHFTPIGLPRLAALHPVSGPEEVGRALAPWSASLSSIGTEDPNRGHFDAGWQRIYSLAPRVVALGQLQRPAFPRDHDGVPMFASVLRPLP
jgi:hypothetical protein